jgi:hypothetical protein
MTNKYIARAPSWHCAWYAFIGSLLLFGSGFANEAYSFDPMCDSHLQAIWGEQGYQSRKSSHRCEGMYESPTAAGTEIEVVSFMLGALRFDLEHDRQLVVSVLVIPELSHDEVRIRGVGLPLRTYYRMDASIASGGQMFWPIQEILEPEAIDASRLGVFGWFGDLTQPTFVPVIVHPEDTPPPSDHSSELKLRTTGQLARLSWQSRDEYAEIDESQWHPIGNETFNEGDVIPIHLPHGPPTKALLDLKAWLPDKQQWLFVTFRVIRPS